MQSWRDVLERTMNIIADLEPEKFGQIVQQFPRFVGQDKKRFREMRQLKNGMFIVICWISWRVSASKWWRL